MNVLVKTLIMGREIARLNLAFTIIIYIVICGFEILLKYFCAIYQKALQKMSYFTIYYGIK